MAFTLKKSIVALTTAATALTGVALAPVASAAPTQAANWDYALVPKSGSITITHTQAALLEKMGAHEAAGFIAYNLFGAPTPLDTVEFLVFSNYILSEDGFHKVAATPGTTLHYSWVLSDNGHVVNSQTVISH